MSRPRVLARVVTALAMVALSGCAAGAPPGSASVTAGGRGGTGTGSAVVPGEAGGAAWLAEVAGVDSDQPCSVRVSAGSEVAPVGVAPQELASLVLTGPELGADWPRWTRDGWAGGYQDDAELAATSQGIDQETCRRLTEYGRLLGYASAWLDTAAGEGTTPAVADAVHVFATAPGAAAFLQWQVDLTSTWSQRTVTVLPEVGPDAVLTTGDAAGGAAVMAAFRVGQLVGVVSRYGTPDPFAAGDVRRLAQLAHRRLATTPVSGVPADVTAVLSAPLPQSAFGPAYRDLEWSWAFGGCKDAYDVSWDSATSESDAQEQARALVVRGWLVSCQALYEDTPLTRRVDSTVFLLRHPDAATDYLRSRVADATVAREGSSPATTFPVPDIPGAVGLRRTVDPGLAMTEVVFPWGRSVGRVFVQTARTGDPTADVVAWARALRERMADHLGPS